MFELLSNLELLNEEKDYSRAIFLSESADKLLGQIYVKVSNKHRTLKQQDTQIPDLAKILAGFRVLGKSDLRAGFADISVPKVFLRLLNDINEVGQERVFGEKDTLSKVTADDRIKQIGETAATFVQQYEELLTQIEEDPDNDEIRDNLLKDINKMRTFFEQAKNKLKTHLAAKAQMQIQ